MRKPQGAAAGRAGAAIAAVAFIAAALPGDAWAAADLATLPRDLSPWGMFLGADAVVRTVMVGLALASLAAWTVWLAKSIELRRSVAVAQRGLERLESDVTLQQAAAETADQHDAVAQMIQTVDREASLSGGAHDDGFP